MEPGSVPWRVLDAATDVSPAHPDGPDEPPHGRLTLLPLVIAGLGIAGLVGVAGLGLLSLGPPGLPASDGGPVVVVETGAAPGSSDAPAGAPPLVIDVGGAVRRPGLVELPPGSRLADAVAAAGGYSPAVDPARIAELNLASLLSDGQQVLVPARGELDGPGAAPGGSGDGAGSGGGPVDLNTATPEQLDALPGIGPVTTQKILAARAERPFRSLEELVERKVLGRSTLQKLDGLAVVR
jgi:competence protein ComEA